MKIDDSIQPNATDSDTEICQVRVKPTARASRSGQNTSAYWKAKLFRNSYRDRRTGEQTLIPEWYCRFRFNGKTKAVRLASADKEQAAEQARILSQKLWAEGWDAVTRRQARSKSTPTVNAICEAYESVVPDLERPPRPISIRSYIGSFRQFCELGNVRQLREINPALIEETRIKYRSEGRLNGRDEDSIVNCWSKIIRNASALFTSAAIRLMDKRGLEIEKNPFAGAAKRQRLTRYRPLGRPTIDRITTDALLLLRGDPEAPPAETDAAGRTFDFRSPQPDAYRALLLALGCGLRASEIDAAQWGWIVEFDGQLALEVPSTGPDGFRPKSGQTRVVPLQTAIRDALADARETTSPYILEGDPRPREAAKQRAYRCQKAFRTLAKWLRLRGVKGRTPIHTLRKEFGSHMASHHGLFHAQAALGHSDPRVTSTYYASPTVLPKVEIVKFAS
jgi:integrase